jgi:hypothetical protein
MFRQPCCAKERHVYIRYQRPEDWAVAGYHVLFLHLHEATLANFNAFEAGVANTPLAPNLTIELGSLIHSFVEADVFRAAMNWIVARAAQVTVLGLDHLVLADADLATVVTTLSQLRRLQHFYLANCTCSNLTGLLQCLPARPMLTEFSIIRVKLTAADNTALAAALTSWNHLETLRLEFPVYMITAGYVDVLKALRTCRRLSRLGLGQSRIRHNGMPVEAMLLCDLPALRSITFAWWWFIEWHDTGLDRLLRNVAIEEIRFSHCTIAEDYWTNMNGPDGLLGYLEGLSSLKRFYIEMLRLSAATMLSIVTALSRCPRLTTFGFVNSPSYGGAMRGLAAGLPLLRHLRVLDLQKADLQSNEMAELALTLPSCRELRIVNCDFAAGRTELQAYIEPVLADCRLLRQVRVNDSVFSSSNDRFHALVPYHQEQRQRRALLVLFMTLKRYFGPEWKIPPEMAMELLIYMIN